MKKRLNVLLFLFIVTIMGCLNVKAENISFTCEYQINNNSSLGTGTLNCTFGYHDSFFGRTYQNECNWLSGTNSEKVNIESAKEFNLNEFIGSGTKECPTYVNVQKNTTTNVTTGIAGSIVVGKYTAYFGNDYSNVQSSNTEKNNTTSYWKDYEGELPDELKKDLKNQIFFNFLFF